MAAGSRHEHIVFFDGICGLCNRLVDFLLRRDKGHRLRFAALQGKTAATMITGKGNVSMDTVIYYRKGRFYYRSTAVILLLVQLGGAWKLMGSFLVFPPFLRNFFYYLVARNRYRFWGKRESCRLPSEEEKVFFLD